MNVEGREPNGQIPKKDYEKFRAKLKEKIENIKDEQGRKLDTVAHIPENIYKNVKRVPPDLIVIFDDLRWRSIGSVGARHGTPSGSIYSYENDTGPDDANHAQQGMYLLYNPKNNLSEKRDDKHHLMDVAPTVLDLLGVQIPSDMLGKSICGLGVHV